MGAGSEYIQEYQRAERAYMLGSYEEAASIIDQLAQAHPRDPSVSLLRGHIYCYGLHQYDVARDQYQAVLQLTEDAEYIDYANKGLADAEQFGSADDSGISEAGYANLGSLAEIDDIDSVFESTAESMASFDNTSDDWQDLSYQQQVANNFTFSDLDEDFVEQDQSISQPPPFSSDPFATSDSPFTSNFNSPDPFAAATDNPFGVSSPPAEDDYFSGDFPDTPASFEDVDLHTDVENVDNSYRYTEDPYEEQYIEGANYAFSDSGFGSTPPPTVDEETLFMNSEQVPGFDLSENNFNAQNEQYGAAEYSGADAVGEQFLTGDDRTFVSSGDVSSGEFSRQDDGFDLEDFDEQDFSTSEEPPLNRSYGRDGNTTNVDFLDEFDEFDDLGSIPDFDVSGHSSGFASPSVGSVVSNNGDSASISEGGGFDFSDGGDQSVIREDEIFSLSGASDQLPTFTQSDGRNVEPDVSVEQGALAFLENAPLARKPWLIALLTGLVSTVVVAAVSYGFNFALNRDNNVSAQAKQEVGGHVSAWGLGTTAAAGLASLATALALGNAANRQVRRAVSDLQNQFEAVSQGNLSARATVFSEDEFGQLATGFNQMARVILTTTSEAQRKAEEQEQAKEDLQRQVIRLLDDVEGAARGDLTVQAEVTADVLGAVADSFNLTIQNLREIVQQVKLAARQVAKSSTENEIFARSLSSDALRQAEELAVTLNSVQVMTDSIQRVAESAREAEEVARSASATALKGGEAVERTVSGILEIRETVAETTRKVKRLAESSQEISKIVALISQIASRTNLLALNASIEAARAGEAGRGFAIVADEVRQLADRAAKSSKEIEQIVLQIQSETGSVMTAMEEGTQQVIEGTRLAEQAKRSLEDIIQVSNRIDVLVRSITSDTVEQTETSRAVAQVMQSVELTAQETSQEAQRVSASLQNLVGVARDLLSSVERFRVEK
jgi:twitching motility protein PilJ